VLWWFLVSLRLAVRKSALCPQPHIPPDYNHLAKSRDVEAEKIWNREKKLFSPRKSLKSNKTAKGIFGKACRIQAKNLERLGEGLEKLVKNLGFFRA
jgi:hypothetical protein